MLASLAELGTRLVVTRSSNERALAPATLAERARQHFATVELVEDPVAAVRRAHALGEPVLITGSLYLLADSRPRRPRERSRMRERLTAVTVAIAVVLALVGIAFAAGYILGKLLI